MARKENQTNRHGRSRSARPARRGASVGVADGAGLRLLFVSSECVPFAKTGGLGDAVAGLSKALCRRGHDVRVLMPLYRSIDRARHGLAAAGSACVHMGQGEEQWVGVQQATLDGAVPVWFLDYGRFYDRPGLYDEAGGEYGDNAFRFALLSKAALQLCKDRAWIPHLMHVHDWPTALVAAYLKTWDRILSPLSATASVLTIHNIGYQGVYHASAFPYIGVGWEHFTPDKFEDHGKINLLKAGIHFADALTTVSPTHAREILTPEGGKGLAPFLQARRDDLFGILNGADYEQWNPATDRLIPARFTRGFLPGKAVCKTALQQRFRLAPRADWPLFGIVSRLVPQKGFELLMRVLPAALSRMAFQLVVLGTGERHIEEFFRWLQLAYPARVGAHIGFSNELSHWIEAGSDFFLMPSLYEPCGLNQIYSLKYGTLPIVRATGGLDDTVENYDETTGQGTGFKFHDPTDSALYNTIGWAIATWFDRPHHIARLRDQAMARDFSWDKSAREYERAYRRALDKKRLAST